MEKKEPRPKEKKFVEKSKPKKKERKIKVLENAYQAARADLGQTKPKLEDFTDLYGDEQVRRDIQEVKRLKKIFDKKAEKEGDAHKYATILEALVVLEAQRCKWFGKEPYKVMATSEYDDYINGIDSIVEFQREEGVSYLGLAIDATFSPDVSRKMKRILKEIDQGKIPEVKYFESDYVGFKGMKKKMPKVVAGVDIHKVKQLMNLRVGESGKRLGRETVIKRLSGHVTKDIFLQEMKMQLEFFEQYAKNRNQDEIARVYKQSLRVINKILAEQEEKIPVEKLREDDKVFDGIATYLDYLKMRYLKK